MVATGANHSSISQPVKSLGHIVSLSISQSFLLVEKYLTSTSNLGGRLKQNCLLC